MKKYLFLLLFPSLLFGAVSQITVDKITGSLVGSSTNLFDSNKDLLCAAVGCTTLTNDLSMVILMQNSALNTTSTVPVATDLSITLQPGFYSIEGWLAFDVTWGSISNNAALPGIDFTANFTRFEHPDDGSNNVVESFWLRNDIGSSAESEIPIQASINEGEQAVDTYFHVLGEFRVTNGAPQTLTFFVRANEGEGVALQKGSWLRVQKLNTTNLNVNLTVSLIGTQDVSLLGNLNVASNINAEVVNATTLTGDGSGITGLPAGSTLRTILVETNYLSLVSNQLNRAYLNAKAMNPTALNPVIIFLGVGQLATTNLVLDTDNISLYGHGFAASTVGMVSGSVFSVSNDVADLSDFLISGDQPEPVFTELLHSEVETHNLHIENTGIATDTLRNNHYNLYLEGAALSKVWSGCWLFAPVGHAETNIVGDLMAEDTSATGIASTGVKVYSGRFEVTGLNTIGIRATSGSQDFGHYLFDTSIIMQFTNTVAVDVGADLHINGGFILAETGLRDYHGSAGGGLTVYSATAAGYPVYAIDGLSGLYAHSGSINGVHFIGDNTHFKGITGDVVGCTVSSVGFRNSVDDDGSRSHFHGCFFANRLVPDPVTAPLDMLGYGIKNAAYIKSPDSGAGYVASGFSDPDVNGTYVSNVTLTACINNNSASALYTNENGFALVVLANAVKIFSVSGVAGDCSGDPDYYRNDDCVVCGDWQTNAGDPGTVVDAGIPAPLKIVSSVSLSATNLPMQDAFDIGATHSLFFSNGVLSSASPVPRTYASQEEIATKVDKNTTSYLNANIVVTNTSVGFVFKDSITGHFFKLGVTAGAPSLSDLGTIAP